MNFPQFLSDIESHKWNVHGLEVYKDGLLAHSYGDTKGIYDIYSATKSIVSIAVGMAYDQGLIDLLSSILRYLPASSLSELDETQKSIFEKITIERLLTMSVAGFAFRPDGDNYLDFALHSKIQNVEQRTFAYSNIPAYLVGVALTQIFNQDLGNYIEEKILKPLEIQEYEYGRSPEGFFYGASKMKMSVHSLSKIGLLMMGGGLYQGKRLLSQEYVKLATSIQQQNREGGYGYYFWKYHDGFSINGKWGQKCYCLPDQGLMVTFFSHIESGSDELRESMERNILEF